MSYPGYVRSVLGSALERNVRCHGEENVRDVVRWLCHALKIRPPRLKFQRMGCSMGWYSKSRHEVRISPDAKRWLVIHEVAHHLHRVEVERRRKEGDCLAGYENGDSSHGASFKNCLLACARLFYGDPADYPWDTEYRAIANWWKRERKIHEGGTS